MARAGQRVKALRETGLADRIGIGALAAAYPPDLVNAAVDLCGVRELRKRDLPAWLTTYFTVAMVLFFDCGYGEVWNKLLAGLSWAGALRLRGEDRTQPSPAAITKARARLGWEPLAELLSMSMAASQSEPEDASWAYWRGLRKLAIDEVTVNVQASESNDAEFSSPPNVRGEGVFPRIRIVALAETGNRALWGVKVEPFVVGEQAMVRELWPLLKHGDLVVADRLSLSYEDLAAVVATGAHAVFRVKADADLPLLAVLPDGSLLSRIVDPQQAGRPQREEAAPADIPSVTVRVIEYSVASKGEGHGRPAVGESFRLVTTLCDHEAYPIEEFPDRYAERWRIETVLSEVKAGSCGESEVVLRSKSPDMVRQEVYALLCVYQAVRHLIAAATVRVDPERISFTRFNGYDGDDPLESTRTGVPAPPP